MQDGTSSLAWERHLHREKKKIHFLALVRSRRYLDLEKLKVICHKKEGDEKRAPFSRSHTDKQVGESACMMILNQEGATPISQA